MFCVFLEEKKKFLIFLSMWIQFQTPRDTEDGKKLKIPNYFLLKPVATNFFSCILLCRSFFFFFAQQKHTYFIFHPQQHIFPIVYYKYFRLNFLFKDFSILDFPFEKKKDGFSEHQKFSLWNRKWKIDFVCCCCC